MGHEDSQAFISESLRSLTASKQPTIKIMDKNTNTTDRLAVDSASTGSLVVWIPFRDSDGTLDVSEATKFEMCADDMLNDGWRWIKFNEENDKS